MAGFLSLGIELLYGQGLVVEGMNMITEGAM